MLVSCHMRPHCRANHIHTRSHLLGHMQGLGRGAMYWKLITDACVQLHMSLERMALQSCSLSCPQWLWAVTNVACLLETQLQRTSALFLRLPAMDQ